MAPTSPRFCYDLFISYAHRDDHDGWVAQLVEAIGVEHARFTPTPLEVFFDRSEIRTLDDWEHRILRGLRGSRVMLAVLSPLYFASVYCRKEWELYLEHELDHAMPGEAIAPIYIVTVPGFEDEAQAALDAWLTNLRRRQYLDLRDWRTQGPEALRREDARRRLERLDQDLAEALGKAERISAAPATIPPHNRNFVGRVEELRQLREVLALGRVGAITALHGLGGIGKSALAFEYAHAFAAEYPGGRLLVPAAGIDDLRVAFLRLAEPRGITLTDDERKDLDAAFARVRAELERGPRTLMLLDNVDTPALLAPHHRARFLPAADHLHVLVTTRLEPERLPGLDCLALEALPEPDALRLLEKYRPFADAAEREAARQIVRRLGGHALAVEVMAVFLWRTPEVSYVGSLARLEREGLGGLEGIARGDVIELTRHSQKVISELLRPTLEALSPSETLAIEFAALLPPDQVVLPWLRDLVGQRFPEVASEPEPGYPDAWRAIERRLLGLRLLTRGDSPNLARMHRLVQDVVAARLASLGHQQERRSALIAHARAQAQFLREGWVMHAHRWEIEPLRQFALLLLDAHEADGGTDLANRVQEPMKLLGRSRETQQLLRRAIAVGSKAYDPGHPTLATIYSNLALVEKDLGNLSEARELLRRALAINEKAYDPGHPTLATIYSNLALVEQDLGNLSEARELLRRAIAIDEKAFDPGHPTLATIYSNLALVEQDLGNLSEARELLRRAIAINEKAYDPDHPMLATSYNNLAYVEQDLGHLAEARQWMHRAYQIWLSRLGPQHQHTQASATWLARHDPKWLAERSLEHVAAPLTPEEHDRVKPWWKFW